MYCTGWPKKVVHFSTHHIFCWNPFRFISNGSKDMACWKKYNFLGHPVHACLHRCIAGQINDDNNVLKAFLSTLTHTRLHALYLCTFGRSLLASVTCRCLPGSLRFSTLSFAADDTCPRPTQGGGGGKVGRGRRALHELRFVRSTQTELNWTPRSSRTRTAATRIYVLRTNRTLTVLV